MNKKPLIPIILLLVLFTTASAYDESDIIHEPLPGEKPAVQRSQIITNSGDSPEVKKKLLLQKEAKQQLKEDKYNYVLERMKNSKLPQKKQQKLIQNMPDCLVKWYKKRPAEQYRSQAREEKIWLLCTKLSLQ